MTFAEMKNIDPKTVDPGKLTDIADVTVNTRFPLPERLADYLNQIGNPYCFRCGNAVVKIAFADTTITFEDALEQFIRQRQLAEHTCL